MIVDQVIERILSKHAELSKETILKKLEMEKHRTGGLISDDTLLRIIAAEFGVEILNVKAFEPTLLVGDLVPNLSDATVIGRVVAVFPLKAFNGRRSGKFASVLIIDRSGTLRIVFWNDKASLLESGAVKVGQVMRVSHGYTKEDRGGKVELHVGEKSEVEIEPKDVEIKAFPNIDKFSVKIAEILVSDRNKKVNLAGTVKDVFAASAFERQDSSSGKIMRLLLTDETGEVSVVVWNEKVDELEGTLRKDMQLQIVNGKVRRSLRGDLEIHIDSGTYVEAFEAAARFSKITDLREGLVQVNVEGEVITRPVVREVKTAKGELVKLAVFELRDESGRIWVSAWRKHAEKVSVLSLGDRVTVKNAYARRGFSDELEISTSERTSIVFLSKEAC
jgi:replication factor A1